jgi:hypothetical protein
MSPHGEADFIKHNTLGIQQTQTMTPRRGQRAGSFR